MTTALPLTEEAAMAAVAAACRELKLPAVAAEAARLADIALRERLTHRAYLAALLAAEVDERTSRRIARRISEARFPRTKRLADFDCAAAPTVSLAAIATLAAGAYLASGDPVVLLGDSGTGKTHCKNGSTGGGGHDPNDSLALDPGRDALAWIRLPAASGALWRRGVGLIRSLSALWA